MQYVIDSLNVYKKGDLEGYADGIIRFSNEHSHEFLFRILDPENGDSDKLVTVDYGYENPFVAELWNDIEQSIREKIKEHSLDDMFPKM